MNRRTWLNRTGRLLLVPVIACATTVPATPVQAATVKRADDTTVTGALVALENGAVVLNVDNAGKLQRTPIPLEDVVELTVDPKADVPPPPAPAATAPTTVPAPGATAAPAAAPAASPAFFDGRTLAGWEGEAGLWKVREGVLTGMVVDDAKENRVTFLPHTAAQFADFQLTYTFKINGGPRGASGVQFRSAVSADDAGRKSVKGYQQDLGTDPGFVGGIYDTGKNANGQPAHAPVGLRVVVKADGSREESALAKSAEELNALVRVGDWNDAALVAKGNTIVSMINGEVFAVLVNQTPAAAQTGSIAIELSRRQAITAEFKNLALRPLAAHEMPTVAGAAWAELLKDSGATPAGAGAAAAPAAPPGSAPGAARPAAAATQAAAKGGWRATLAGGDQLSGDLVAWDEKQLTLKTSHGELAIPVARLREVWRGSADEVNKARAASAAAGTGGAGEGTRDVAFARQNDQVIPVAGLALGTAGGVLKFRFREQERNIALDKLVGVTLAAAEDTLPDESLRQSFALASGDVVSGTWAALDGGTVTLNAPWGASLSVPIKDVQRVRTKNGRLVYLSDLTPAQVEQVPYFDRLLPFRVDKSLTGGPIKLADGDHARGVSVHSRTVLRYDVGRRFERFRAKVGFQLPEGKAGRAAIRVLGDDKVLHETPDARGDQPPADLDLAIAGVSRLTLEVDFGADQDVADRVAWADARLLRPASAPPAAAAAR